MSQVFGILRILGLLFCFFITTGRSLADAPPSWSEFEIQSNNKKFVAKIEIQEADNTVAESGQRYKLSVFHIAAEQQKLLWFCDYDHTGYPEGVLSPDGECFASVSPWYEHNAPVVYLYCWGDKTTFKGRDFDFDRSKLKPTVSHLLWLAEDGPQYQFIKGWDSPTILEIITIDNKEHQFDPSAQEWVQDFYR